MHQSLFFFSNLSDKKSDKKKSNILYLVWNQPEFPGVPAVPVQGGQAASLQWTSCWTWQRMKEWWTFSTASESYGHSESTWCRRRSVLEQEKLTHRWGEDDGEYSRVTFVKNQVCRLFTQLRKKTQKKQTNICLTNCGLCRRHWSINNNITVLSLIASSRTNIFITGIILTLNGRRPLTALLCHECKSKN